MIEGFFIKVAIVIGLLFAIFIFGYFKGKNIEQHKQLKKGVDDALKTQKRRAKRRNDSDDTIIKRMHKYIRR